MFIALTSPLLSIVLFQLDNAGVPLLIFSAGIGDVIEEVIKQQAVLHDNIRIVSNYMDFNTQVAFRSIVTVMHSGGTALFMSYIYHFYNYLLKPKSQMLIRAVQPLLSQ